jgi:CcmD family protein
VTDAQKFWYLFWGYNIIWLLLAAYLLTLGARQRRIQRIIDRLRETLGLREE